MHYFKIPAFSLIYCFMIYSWVCPVLFWISIHSICWWYSLCAITVELVCHYWRFHCWDYIFNLLVNNDNIDTYQQINRDINIFEMIFVLMYPFTPYFVFTFFTETQHVIQTFLRFQKLPKWHTALVQVIYYNQGSIKDSIIEHPTPRQYSYFNQYTPICCKNFHLNYYMHLLKQREQMPTHPKLNCCILF